MRRSLLYAAVALPLYTAVPILIGIAGRDIAAKPSPRFPAADPAAVVRFHAHYNAYFRHLFGCPTTATDAAECRPAAGWIDTNEWHQARDLAKTVFALKD